MAAKIGRILLRVGIFATFVIAGFYFIGAFRHYETEPVPLSYGQYVAKYGDSNLPTNASGIQMMNASIGMGGSAWAHRFSAPLDDMKRYAETEFSRYDKGPAKTIRFQTETNLPTPNFEAYGIGRLPWFEFDGLTNVLTIPRDHIGRPVIYIDTNSLTYYSWWTR